ncbi:MAG: nitroreductase family protein [Pseudomonadota bacterium]
MYALLLLAGLACHASPTPATDASETRALPPPVTTGGMPLMEAIAKRHSTRDFSKDPVTDQVLSDLLWAAWGVHQPDDGHRTAPSAMNNQEIDLYVIQATGAWRYDAQAHALALVTAQDLRRDAGMQPFVWKAPLNIVYVADHARMRNIPEGQREHYAAADAGFIAQNVYLYCASAGLGTVIRGLLDRDALKGRLGLGDDQAVLLAQTVGWPE